MDPKMKHAMSAVLEGMGRAAREGKMRRFAKKDAPHPTLEIGEVELKPSDASPMSDKEVDPLKSPDVSDDEMAELMGGIQR